MNMNYEPMWAVVDAHRRCADELEQTLRELTGDRPVSEVDRVSLYTRVTEALCQARQELDDLAAREGHTIRRRDASRCRVFAQRCDAVVRELQKLGELA